VEEIASTASGLRLATDSAPPADPIALAVTSRIPGPVVIVETSTTVSPPSGFALADRQVHLEAPAATPARPLVLRFTVDGALLGVPGRPKGVKIFKDGALVGRCTGRAGGASPDPCLRTRLRRGASSLRLKVLSSTGGEWNFGLQTTFAALDRCLGGTELRLQERPRRMRLRSQDASELVLGDGADVAELVADGGSLRVVAIGGDGFEKTYDLPAAGWRVLDPTRPERGLRFRARRGPIRSVVLEAGRLLEVTGRGPRLAQSLGSDPALVKIQLQLGSYRYRLAFGGDAQRFQPNKKLVRKSAARPSPCDAGMP
jgi:hypothetical protein